jgi:hypothetical protein
MKQERSRRMRVVGVLLVAMATGACGKGGGAAATTTVNMESPRGTADGLVKAFGEHNANLAASLLPTPELLKASFECPEDQLVKAVQARRERATKEIGEAPKGVTMEIAAFDKSGSGERQLRVGDQWEGCKAKAGVTVHTSKVDLRLTQDGKVEFDGETWTFLKFGDEPKWYYFR